MTDDRLADLMTPAEVATMKGCNLATVYQALNRGQLASVKVLNRRAVRRTDAEAWQPGTWGGSRGGGRPKKQDIE